MQIGDGTPRWTCPACGQTFTPELGERWPKAWLREAQRRHPNNSGRCTRAWIERAKPLRRGKRDEIRRRRDG